MKALPRGRYPDGLVTAGLGLYSLGLVLWLLTSPGVSGAVGRARVDGLGDRVFRQSVSLLIDDGFYYLQIARNVARGAGSTFSGLELTNGYHPLWMLALVPLFHLTESPDVALIVSILLQAVVMAAGVAVGYRTARLSLGCLASTVVALVWLALTYRLALSGLEFGLQALCILVIAFVYRRSFSAFLPGTGTFLGLGGLLVLAFLARVETIALAGAIGLHLVLRQARAGFDRRAFTCLAVFALPIVLAALAYGVVSVGLFGEPFPVSGYIKRTESAGFLSRDPYYLSGGWLLAKLALVLWFRHMGWSFILALTVGSAGAAVLLVTGFLMRHRPGWGAWSRDHLFPWAPFILFSLGQALAYASLYHGGLSFQPWYFVVQPWLAALLLGAALDTGRQWVALVDTWSGLRALMPVVSALLLLAGPIVTARSLGAWASRMRVGLAPTERLAYEPLDSAALWLRTTRDIPPGAVIGAWNAGAIAYLSGRTVVNLDGLVNSWEFARHGRADLCVYARTKGLTHLVDVWSPDDAPPAAAFRSCAGRLETIWTGPGYPSRPDRRAAAYRIRGDAP